MKAKYYLMLTVTLILFSCLHVIGKASTSKEGHHEDLNVLLDKLREAMKKEHIPGLMISIVKGDSIVYAGGLGYADLHKMVPVNPQTIFQHHSITKMFTAMAILKLVHEGKFKLDDELKKLAPEIEFHNQWENHYPIKVKHLLEHTAGFDDVHLNNMYSNKPEKHRGLEAVMIFKNSFVSRWKPGERMSYSNPGYTILGYLIEKFSKKPWSSFIKENIFNPIGMQNASCELNIQNHASKAIGYLFHKGNYISFPYNYPAGTGAGSALQANALDMARFVRFFLNNWRSGSSEWLPLYYLKEMETVHSTLAAKNGLKLGYAFANEKFPNNPKVTFRGHFGGDNGFESLVLYNRENKIGYAISNNGYQNMGRLSRLIEEYLTADLPSPKEIKPIPLPRDADNYLGYYQFLNTRSSKWNFLQKITKGFKLEKSADKLVLKWLFGRPDTLYRVEGMLFKRKHHIDPYYVFGKDDEGKVFFQGVRNEYYQETSYVPVLLQQVLLILMALAFAVSVIIAIIILVQVLLRKSKTATIGPVFFPILAFVSGFLAYRAMIQADHFNKLAFNDLNASSGSIFFGSLGFAVFIITAIISLYKRWNDFQSVWIRFIICFNLIILACFTVYIGIHGWIGIRVWDL